MHAFVLRISRLMAYMGGIVLVALILMTCVSIAGRSMNGVLHAPFMQTNLPALANWLIDAGVGPLNGDYELVEAGMAFAIFAFLPLCHISSAHASVDILTTMMSARVNRVLLLVSELLFSLVLILIAWQLFNGLTDKYRSGETTLLLQFPVWWPYMLSLVGAVLSACVGVYVAVIRAREWSTGTEILPSGPGGEH